MTVDRTVHQFHGSIRMTFRLTILLLACLLAGCGGQTPTSPEALSSSLGRTQPADAPAAPLTTSSVGQFAPYVFIASCSNAVQVEEAYRARSSVDLTASAGMGGADFARWGNASDDPRVAEKAWANFDAALVQHGQPSAVVFIGCVKVRSGYGQAQAAADLDRFNERLRTRTAAPLYITSTNGSQGTACKVDDDALQVFVADRAVALGYAQYGPMIPPASAPAKDKCHFDPAASTNVGDVMVAFLD